MDEAETAPAKRATLLLAAEDTANVLTHAITIPYAFLAILDLQLHTNTSREFIVLSLYGWVMLSLFTVSAIYHFTSLLADLYPDGRWYSYSRNFLRIVDRSLIHCFIAACYTPWLLLRENGPFAEYVCQAVWFFALFSIIAQNSPFTFAMADTETCVIGSYLLLGVLPATFICAYATDISSLIPLAQGGALYIIGLTFYFAEGYFPFSHAIWHMFVNSGAYLHYSALNEFQIRERMLAQQQQQMLDSTWYSWIASTWHAHVY